MIRARWQYLQTQLLALGIPKDITRKLVSLAHSHYGWSSAPIAHPETEVDALVRVVRNRLRDFLPPLAMLKLGTAKSWKEYESAYWNDFDYEPFFKSADYTIQEHAQDRYGDLPRGLANELDTLSFDLRIPSSIRPEGHMIMAPPGHGKTSCLENMILDDVQSGATVIVLDSQEGMIDRLLRYLPEDRTSYLDASALHAPLALSAFEVDGANGLQGEAKLAQSLDLFENMFSSMDFTLTSTQRTLFRNLCRFLTVIPHAGFDTALDVLRNGCDSYAQFIHQLPPNTAAFVTENLGSASKRGANPYKDRRREVAARFEALGEHPHIQRMFNAPVRKVDFATEIQNHKLVLINTAQATLSPSGASLFGRYCLMQIALEVLSRPETLDPKQRVYFYIDEAQEYFTNAGLLSLIFEQGRKRGLCMVCAFHHLGQLTRISSDLSDMMRSLTAIKFIKASNATDANTIGRDIQVDPSELQSVTKRHFAVHCRDVGYGVFKIADPSKKMKARRSWDEVTALKSRMHKRFGYGPQDNAHTTSRSSLGDIDPDAPQQFD